MIDESVAIIDTEIDFEKRAIYLESKVKELQAKLDFYESNGAAKLYYAINRKASEMAELLNRNNLLNLPLEDPKDKTFERLKTIWGDSSAIGEALKNLATSSGMITGDEKADVAKKPFIPRTTPESIAVQVGDYKPQNI